MLIDRRKKLQKPNKVKPVKNVNKKLQSFLNINSVQKEAPPSYKLQDHTYE